MRQVRRVAALLVCLLVAGMFVIVHETIYVTQSGARDHSAVWSSLRYSKARLLLSWLD